jgi:glycolate oxidase FAD binding subunit
MSDAIPALRAQILSAAQSSTPLRIVGGGTKDFYGQSFEGEPLDTTTYSGVVDYEPTELVITARCGTRVAELERVMRERGQYLAFDPPQFGAGGTVGGLVAAGLSGPRRQAVGSVRDFLLGARLMDGKGEVLTFGGQVMKNVAGFDVSRLLAGSLGTLGVILEVSLKALPLPVAEETLKLELPPERALAVVNEWGGKPLPISATAYTNGELTVRLSGAAAAVHAARAQIGGERTEDAQAARFWTGIRDHTDPFFKRDAPLWRVSVPSTATWLDVQGEQLVEWGGALRWIATGADAKTVREVAAKAGGHATLFRGGDKSVGVFHPLTPSVAALHKKLKAEFDPAGLFNRGRMFKDW